jgi:hypothetical protein
MAKNIHVMIVHGIGTPLPGYSEPLVKGITARFNRYLQQAQKSSEDFSKNLVVREVIWDGVLAANQEKLALRLRKGFTDHKAKGFRSVLSGVFSFVTKPLLKLRTDFAAESISDILGYKNPDAYPQIHKCLADAVETFVDLTMNPDDKQHLSIICHSLGTVISSDFIYDRQKKFGRVHENFHFNNFFTCGSPIALFALEYGIEVFRSPVLVEAPGGQWINILDLDDPVAYPLKNLNDAYDQAVNMDYEVNTGGFGASHTRYFENVLVQDKIAEKLGQDWLRLNSKLR